MRSVPYVENNFFSSYRMIICSIRMANDINIKRFGVSKESFFWCIHFTYSNPAILYKIVYAFKEITIVWIS